jgi:hypothetical protein
VGDESVVLTDREREALAGLAETIGDPWLARQLAGQDKPPPPPRRHRFGPLAAALLKATAGWIGLILIVVGGAMAVTTFVHSMVAATLGLAVMGFGAWRLATEHGGAVIRRWTARRTPPAEPRPHRQPGAA